jgi:prepilin-type N-terminal cleavage/methylation domain-containing protein
MSVNIRNRRIFIVFLVDIEYNESMPTALKIRAFRIAQRLRRAFNPKHRAHRAFTLPELRGRHTLRPRRAVVWPDEGGFTLLELLAVMGIISLLLVALVPAVTSLSKSGGRRAARNSLLGGIEQARAEAIKSSQATYVVFPAFTSGTQSTLDRYNYRSYAIFEDDAANPGNVKQLTDWKSFPTGVALRAAGTAALSNLADPATLTPSVAFSFAPDASAAPLKCFKFNSNGEVQAPAGNVLLGIFEGYVNSGTEIATTKDASGNPSAVEYVMVSQFTGRAEPTATPSP